MSLESINWILAFLTLPGFFMLGAVAGGRTKPFITYNVDLAIIILSVLIWMGGLLNTFVQVLS